MSNSSILDNTEVLTELKDYFQKKVPPYPPIIPYDSFFSFQYSLPAPFNLTGNPGGSGSITVGEPIPVKAGGVIYIVGEINETQTSPDWTPMTFGVNLYNSSGATVFEFPNSHFTGGWATPGSSNNSGDTIFGACTVPTDDTYIWKISIQAGVNSTSQTINAGGMTNFIGVRIPAYANF